MQQEASESLAEVAFLQAIHGAQAMEARSWELRATLSLCRLWRGQGRQQEALAALRAIYDWFSEGFATPDLQQAKVLLEDIENDIL